MEAKKTEDTIREVELLNDTDGCESRVVSMVLGESCAITEHTRGDLTEACYGVQSHGHKVVFSAAVGSRVFEVSQDQLEEELTTFFGEGAFLSDLQDLLDQMEARYCYASWAGNAVVYRGA